MKNRFNPNTEAIRRASSDFADAISAAVASHTPSYAIKYDLSGEEMCWATAQAHSALMSGSLLAACDLPPDMAGSLAATLNEAVDKAVNDWLDENAGDEPSKRGE